MNLTQLLTTIASSCLENVPEMGECSPPANHPSSIFQGQIFQKKDLDRSSQLCLLVLCRVISGRTLLRTRMKGNLGAQVGMRTSLSPLVLTPLHAL